MVGRCFREVEVPAADGTTDFSVLQNELRGKSNRLVIIAFVESRQKGGNCQDLQIYQPLCATPARAARERHHVPNTFKAQGDHFQGLREPSSQPKFHPLHGPANGHQCVEGQENGHGRYCHHNLRRALPRTPYDVAVLLSAG
jgi:hypothetical protein